MVAVEKTRKTLKMRMVCPPTPGTSVLFPKALTLTGRLCRRGALGRAYSVWTVPPPEPPEKPARTPVERRRVAMTASPPAMLVARTLKPRLPANVPV